MQNNDSSMSDPVEAALGFDEHSGGNPEALRGAIFEQTLGVIRFHRRVKRGLFAVSLFGCYLAGAVTVGLLRIDARQTAVAPPAPMTVVHPKEIVGQEEDVASPQEITPTATAVVEFQPPAKMPTAFESWRNVGDYYLRKYGDISLATASYAQAIDLATEEERAIAPGKDNWLLMALKDARTKEKRYASCQQN
jgi:hypothetical protein